MGLRLNPENWWIKKARNIPWEEIELRYAQLFTNRKGNVAKPLRLALGACIIQAEYGYFDEEIVLQIQEGAYLQYFCGYREYDDSKPPFDPSLMVHFRKRLTPEVLGEISEMIIDELHMAGEEKPRTYRKQAHRDYMKFARSRKHTKTLVRKSIRKQLNYLSRDLAHIDAMLADGKFSAISCRPGWRCSPSTPTMRR